MPDRRAHEEPDHAAGQTRRTSGHGETLRSTGGGNRASGHGETLRASGGTVRLPRTGQTTCYDTAGLPIDCFGTGQDGMYQAGTAWPLVRFIDNGDETVTDTLTGLMWVRDGNLMNTRDQRLLPLNRSMHIHPGLSEVVERACTGFMPVAHYNHLLLHEQGIAHEEPGHHGHNHHH